MQGTVPLYSANVFKPVGLLPKSNVTDFNNEFILWGIDGDFEFNYIKKGEKFATTDHCGAIRIKTDKILPSYLLCQLNDVKQSYGYDRVLRASLKNMKEIEIKIPINSKGDFDLEKQNEISSAQSVILDLKQKIKDYKNKLENVVIETEQLNNLTMKEVPMEGIFDFPSIKGLTAKFIQSNAGDIPVYGGRIEETPIGQIKDNLKCVKYFENCLAWNREGSVGYVFWHKHKFTTNDHHRPLIVKPEFKSVIDLSYMKYEIQEVLLKQGFKWSKTASKEKVEKIFIKVPVIANGNYDLSAQKEIASKYLMIDQIKQELENKLNDLLKVNVNI